MERCDIPQGFQLFHSIAGGWGSGLGTLLLLKIRDNYPDRCTSTLSLYPSFFRQGENFPQHHWNFEIYNAVLSIHQLLENSDLCYNFDNGKLFNYAKQCKLKHPTYDDLNWLLSQAISGMTSTLRFHAEPSVNVTMTSFGVALIPFPRLHFFVITHSPFYGKTHYKYNNNVNKITGDLMNNDLAMIKLEDGKILTSSFVYRGHDEDGIAKMDEHLLKIQYTMADDFVTWIPGINVQSAFVYDGDNHCYSKYAPVIGTGIIATTAIKGVFQRISASFAKSYKRKAYLHWYKAEGMDEMEFQEADKNCRDLITEYQDKQDAVVDLEDDYDEDEDDEDSDEPDPYDETDEEEEEEDF